MYKEINKIACLLLCLTYTWHVIRQHTVLNLLFIWSPAMLCEWDIVLISCVGLSVCVSQSVSPLKNWNLLIWNWCNLIAVCVMVNRESPLILMIFDLESYLSISTRHPYVRYRLATQRTAGVSGRSSMHSANDWWWKQRAGLCGAGHSLIEYTSTHITASRRCQYGTSSGVVERESRGTPFPQIFCGGTPFPQMISGQGRTMM